MAPGRIKIQRFWTPRIKAIVKDYNELPDKTVAAAVQPLIGRLLAILTNKGEPSKERVMVTFVLEALPHVVSLAPDAVPSLVALVDSETDDKVREFAAWILGELVVTEPHESPLSEVRALMERLRDDPSEKVAAFARDYHDQVQALQARLQSEAEQVQELARAFISAVDEHVQAMVGRADEISRVALDLDYREAAIRKESVERMIRDFKQRNEQAERELRDAREQHGRQYPTFERAVRDAWDRWVAQRSEREALIRKVHCILRIQSKIFLIISYILDKGQANAQLSREDFAEISERTDYTESEIVGILERLVDDELIPNLLTGGEDQQKPGGSDAE